MPRNRLLELARLVAAMREAQTEFFRTRNPDWLSESKRLERQVDRELEAVERECGDAPQKTLF